MHFRKKQKFIRDMIQQQLSVMKRGIIPLYKIGILFLEREFEHDVYELIRAFYPESSLSSFYAEDEVAECDLFFRVEEKDGNCLIRYENNEKKGVITAEFTEGQSSDALISCDDREGAHSIRKERKDQLKIALYHLLVKLTGKTLPWGTLTGIRPTKIALSRLDQGVPEEEIREFMEKTIGDLVKARDLLKTFDVEVNPSYATSTAYRFFGSSNPAQGKFYNNRGTRLNYYAVTVLLARACLWAQKTDDALTYAQEIIDLVTAKTLQFSTSGSILSVPKMFDDLLFGFYQEKLTETFEPYVNNTNSRRLTIDDKTFFTTPTNDKRSGFIKTSTNFLTKYTVNVSDEKDKIVPNIRISEAYYIAAECLYKTDMKTAAADLMVVRKARGYSSPVLSGTMTEDAFWEALTYEYRKEFIGEGQLIFFYKRTNRPITFSEGKFDHKGKLTLPVPDSESAI